MMEARSCRPRSAGGHVIAADAMRVSGMASPIGRRRRRKLIACFKNSRLLFRPVESPAGRQRPEAGNCLEIRINICFPPPIMWWNLHPIWRTRRIRNTEIALSGQDLAPAHAQHDQPDAWPASYQRQGKGGEFHPPAGGKSSRSIQSMVWRGPQSMGHRLRQRPVRNRFVGCRRPAGSSRRSLYHARSKSARHIGRGPWPRQPQRGAVVDQGQRPQRPSPPSWLRPRFVGPANRRAGESGTAGGRVEQGPCRQPSRSRRPRCEEGLQADGSPLVRADQPVITARPPAGNVRGRRCFGAQVLAANLRDRKDPEEEPGHDPQRTWPSNQKTSVLCRRGMKRGIGRHRSGSCNHLNKKGAQPFSVARPNFRIACLAGLICARRAGQRPDLLLAVFTCEFGAADGPCWVHLVRAAAKAPACAGWCNLASGCPLRIRCGAVHSGWPRQMIWPDAFGHHGLGHRIRTGFLLLRGGRSMALAA